MTPPREIPECVGAQVTPPREIPEWMRAQVQTQALVVRSLDSVTIAMSLHDYNALVMLLGVAAAAGPELLQTSLRLMRAFNPAPPEAAP